MSRILTLLGVTVLGLVPAHAAVQNISVQTTSTQAVISFTVADPARCAVQIFTSSQPSAPADDTNNTLFPGSEQCNRAGSAVNGTTVSFVAGTRTAAKASDGNMHSRALAANTTYYYVILDMTDSMIAQGPLTTANLAAGNLYPEQPPFDPNGWDNRGHPQFDWTTGQRNQMLVDPTTGLLVKRMTFAGDAYAYSRNSGDQGGAQLAAAVVASGGCTNSANLTTNGAALANCTGTAVLFLPVPAMQMAGTGTFNNWYPRFNVDDLILYAYGSSDAAAAGASNGSDTVAVCLAQGANLPCLSKQFLVKLNRNAGMVKVPANTPAPVFSNWGYTPLHGDVVPTPGTVSVSGSTVTLTNPGQWNTYATAFNVDWPAGSQIYIAGSSAWGCAANYCTIASIQSATQLATFESCSAACPASAAYEGRAFGFRIVRQGAAGSVNLSFGFESAQSTSWAVGEDSITQHCNANPVTVTSDANGNPYPGYTLSGYVCLFQHEWAGEAFWLLISRDQNGRPLGEARPLGPIGIPYPVSWNSNGAAFPNGASMSFVGWDATNGGRFLAVASSNSGSTQLLVAGSYDPTKPGCSPAYVKWSGAQIYTRLGAFAADTCFRYTNLTNPSANPPMDLRSQIVRAYANYNPGLDLSGFAVGEAQVSGGFARTCLVATNNGDRNLRVCAAFDATSGSLVQVFDTFSRYPGRWGYAHGPIHVLGKYHSLTLDQPGPGGASPNSVFYGPFEMAVTAVNRAGYGQTPAWTFAGSGRGTAIAAKEAYACPTGVPQFLIDQGAAGNHCIQVQVSSEPCSHTPGAAPIYGGQNEAQRYPCTSTDGSTVTNPAWSKLQNLAVGDWVRQNEDGNEYGEVFIVAAKQAITPSQIQLWLIRGDGVWPNGTIPPYFNLGAAHPDGFSLAATSNWSILAANWTMDATDASATWVPDNPAWVLTHGAQAVGSSPDKRIAIGSDTQDQSKYAGFYDVPVLQQVMRPLPDLTAVAPAWAGSAAGYSGPIQTYMNNDQVSAAPADRTWVVNYRHLNPSSGSGPEYRTSLGPNNPAPVAGTTQVYKLGDPYSGGPADPKRLPFILFAGRFLLRDISGPATAQNIITDETNFAACYALKAGECRTDSAAGDRYISVPFAAGETQCLVNQYEEAAPCFTNASPVAGKVQQMDISGPFDGSGARQRMLPTAFTGIGGIYQFSGPKVTPDAAWMLVPCWWLNGVRSEVCGVYLPPLPASDGTVRSDFVPYDVNVPGQPGDQVRVCWGYAENGPVDGSTNSLYPTSRQERGCSTGGAPAGLARVRRAGNFATTASADTTTQGAWKSAYGSEGYAVAADTTRFSGAAAVAIAGQQVYTWAASTADVRALERTTGAGRIASTYYSSANFAVELKFTDGNQHRAAFYFLDFENSHRTETVQVVDGDTGAVLDTQNLSNFSKGVYLVWNVAGHVKVRVTNTDASGNAVLSGIFLGGPSAAPAPGPFSWASEPPVYVPCDASCRIRVQLIPGRVAYYVVERNNHGQITTSPVMVAVQP
ncbi:MAG TPA: hypothetical protein VGR73_09980 [Bryobacteraceae bacterium]|nr:hypothetical protein [Bryobacteraceae bacterium]